jgi:hypothetical protein
MEKYLELFFLKIKDSFISFHPYLMGFVVSRSATIEFLYIYNQISYVL